MASNPSTGKPTDTGTNAQFELACYQATQLFQERNAEYDGAFKKYGLLGVIFEIMGILNRLPAMTIWKSPGKMLNVKKLHDLFLDLHNYSAMALILLEDNNWDGMHKIREVIREGEPNGTQVRDSNS